MDIYLGHLINWELQKSSSLIGQLAIVHNCDWLLKKKRIYKLSSISPWIYVPQYMRVSDQASHSICSIFTCNHEVVVFYDIPSLFIFCSCTSNIFPCELDIRLIYCLFSDRFIQCYCDHDMCNSGHEVHVSFWHVTFAAITTISMWAL